MIIKDKEGIQYSLTSKGLRTLNRYYMTDLGYRVRPFPLWEVSFEDINTHNRRSAQLYVNGRGAGDYVRVYFGDNQIGCKTFSKTAFNKILKALKEVM